MDKAWVLAQKSESESLVMESVSRRSVLMGFAAAGVAASDAGPVMAQGSTTFDYIVVGSGPGGGPVACNLAKAGYSVCLMEAGGPATDLDLEMEIKLPAAVFAITADPRVSWDYFVRHYADQAQQEKDTKFVPEKDGVLYPRASTIGCAVQNSFVAMYPSNSDWDHIVALTGDTSWSPDLMRDLFQRVEQCNYREASPRTESVERHGFDGWQSTELADPNLFASDPQTSRFIQAAQAVAGQPGDEQLYVEKQLDANDYMIVEEDRQGLYPPPLSTKNGARWSIRDHILATAKACPNLAIMTNCLASRILLDGSNTATGVEYLPGANLYRASPLSDPAAAPPQPLRVHARREVIVSAGTFNSPQLLKLSGIGAREELSAFGIRTRVHLPGVGTGMMDRYEVSVTTQLKEPLGLYDRCTSGAADPCLLDWDQGRGIYTTIPFSIAAIVKSDPGQPVRNLVVGNVYGAFHGYFPGYQNSAIVPDNQTWLLLKAHNENNAGTVKLRSRDPRDVPIVNFHYFEEGTDAAGRDLQGLVDGVLLARKLTVQTADLAVTELRPGPSVQSEGDIAEFIRNEAWGHHASCSNRMGSRYDPMSVVDSNFKVIGTRSLRVVDASVFPRIPGYYITVPILMISEKASDAILADAQASPTQASRGR